MYGGFIVWCCGVLLQMKQSKDADEAFVVIIISQHTLMKYNMSFKQA